MRIDKDIGVRGRLTADADLGQRTWFRAGGACEFLFEPADMDDLALFLRRCPPDIAIEVMGFGSNMLVRDGGVKGVVIMPHFDDIKAEGARIEAGNAVAAIKVSQQALALGLGGFEFMRGIPGSVGGCLAMNAGAYGSETANIFVEAHALDRTGAAHILTKADMRFGYRQALDGYIFTRAVFEGRPRAALEIESKMKEIIAARRAAQPPGGRTSGSTFKNPLLHISHKKAWQLIEEAGCRDFSQGDAYVCRKHCNFLINRGSARAADIEALGEKIRARVKDKTGVSLEWEIRRIGESA